jgi:hypothetical protein
VIAAALAGGSVLATSPAHAAGVSSVTVCSEVVEVRERDTDVFTGCQLQNNDWISLSATGQIWAGVWLTGTNGPEGWSELANDWRYPMASARKYSLLAKSNGFYRYVGKGANFQYVGTGSFLHLRINDDVPGNGNGAFQVTVTVTRP